MEMLSCRDYLILEETDIIRFVKKKNIYIYIYIYIYIIQGRLKGVKAGAIESN